MNRRRLVYSGAALAIAAGLLIADRWLGMSAPKKPAPEPYVPHDPNEPPATMSPAPKKPNEKPIGRPPDVPPKPGDPAMSGTLQVEPTPVPAMNP